MFAYVPIENLSRNGFYKRTTRVFGHENATTGIRGVTRADVLRFSSCADPTNSGLATEFGFSLSLEISSLKKDITKRKLANDDLKG